MDETAALFAFLPRCTSDFVNTCEANRKANVCRNSKPYSWRDIVNVARDELYGPQLVPSALQATSAVPPPRTTPSPTTYQAPANSVKCTCCVHLKIGGDNHPRSECALDPANANFKPALRNRRLQ